MSDPAERLLTALHDRLANAGLPFAVRFEGRRKVGPDELPAGVCVLRYGADAIEERTALSSEELLLTVECELVFSRAVPAGDATGFSALFAMDAAALAAIDADETLGGLAHAVEYGGREADPESTSDHARLNRSVTLAGRVRRNDRSILLT